MDIIDNSEIYNENTYTVKDACEMVGISQATLRDYEKKFNINICKNEKGQRIYTNEDISILKTIRQYRKQKVNIEKIKEIISKGNAYEDVPNDIFQYTRVEELTSSELNNALKEKFKLSIAEIAADISMEQHELLLEKTQVIVKEEIKNQIEDVVNVLKIENNQLRSENKRIVTLVSNLTSKLDKLLQIEEEKNNKVGSFAKLFKK